MSVIVKLKKWKESRPNRNTFPTSHLETWDERQRRKAALIIIYVKTLIYFSVVAMVMPPTWPYLQSLDPNASKTLVGWIIVGVPALRPVNALLVGWLLKKFSIRLVTIVSGVFILVSCAMWSTAYQVRTGDSEILWPRAVWRCGPGTEEFMNLQGLLVRSLKWFGISSEQFSSLVTSLSGKVVQFSSGHGSRCLRSVRSVHSVQIANSSGPGSQ